jgi:hypothetical protein
MLNYKIMRYIVYKTGHNTVGVYDNNRKCCIVKSVSPNAKYNIETVTLIVKLLNDNDKIYSKL